ncbi:MAG: L,D-transpeptidase family protein [Acetobacteraceae bacterium]|nr:L,D-transpeptidase family protein [Acetobacteraceae bacterium]
MQAVVHPDGRLTLQGQVFRCALGRARVSAHKQEGDGATPAGLLPLRRVLYRADKLPPPVCVVPLEPIAENDGWCDDPADRQYNKPVRLPYDASCEELWRQDGLYDVLGVLGWNDAPVVKGRGSAVFLHVARPDYAPTEGCIALALGDLRRVLAAGLTEIAVMGG